MVHLRWTLPALSDLDSIAEYIATDAPERTSTFIKGIIEVTTILIEHPLFGRMIPEVQNPIYRELIYKNYRILYRFQNELVEILTVFHGAKQLDDSITE
jgi:toxin ParE1/3/4